MTGYHLIRPEEGGRIRILLQKTQRANAKRLRISIEDDGPGIHADLLDAIFELGFTTRELDGSGQGLYIARTLVQSLGGEIWVERSHLFWGSCFVIEVPVM